MSVNTSVTGLNTLGFIQENSLTYTEIQKDYLNFINALSEDEKLGFKTLFEGTNGQILIELLAAKSSDEIYHVIASRAENLLYYLNRQDSGIAIAQNSSYSTYRGSNIKLTLTITPNETIVLPKMSSVGIAEDYDLIIVDNLELTQGQSKTFDVYIGNVKEQTLIADTEDLLVFRFTNQNISEQIALYLNGKEVPITRNILGMTDDKYFCITNAYTGVDAIYLNQRTDFTHRYTNNSQLTLKYIEYFDIILNSIDIQSTYGEITNVLQAAPTIKPETVSSIRTNSPLYAETQNRIVARDDFHKVLKDSNPSIVNTVGKDFSNAVVEVSYVKNNGELLSDPEYQAAYDNLYSRRAFGIPMCLLEHPDIMLNLNIKVILQLSQGSSAIVKPYVRDVLARHELILGGEIDFSVIENELEAYDFVQTARVLPMYQTYQPDMLAPEGTIFIPTTPNGKLYVVRNPLFLTGSVSPTWSTAIGSKTTDNDLIWTCEAKSYTPQPNWEPDTPQRKESIVWVGNLPNVQFRCTGYTYKTGSMEPVWPTVLGDFVSDGQILWMAIDKNITAPQWAPGTITEKGYVVNGTVTSSMSFQAINYIPTTPSQEPNWKTGINPFTDKTIQYAVINQTYDPVNSMASVINLAWNQYCIFNETIQVV
jgi:hypothetical protein